MAEPLTLRYGPGCVSVFAERWSEIPPDLVLSHRRVLVVADRALGERFVDHAIEALVPTGAKSATVRIDAARKSIDRVIGVWERMVEFVPDAVIGVGGGTTCDLAGFAASTYQRGIPHALVPTTVLAMLDASIGGKTGVDVGGIKNAIGSMHYPAVTLTVLEALDTLPQAELRSGLSEAVKAGVLFDEQLLADLELLAAGGLADRGALLKAIVRSAELKMRVAERSDREKLCLLYGHAVGHALETAADLPLRHGDAVAIGMTVEGALSVRLGLLGAREWQRQTALLTGLGLPTEIPHGTSFAALIERMARYRKLTAGTSLAFVLPAEIGALDTSAEFLTFLTRDELAAALTAALSHESLRT